MVLLSKNTILLGYPILPQKQPGVNILNPRLSSSVNATLIKDLY
ncbi:hypothetical protein PMG71_09910 [Roseofilum sp. BLCC_M154]|uniref:Uncharacterized protein n=1 Tax=Roseofilum acuticapitatum BLCC-M154 TaxID=3022444 RepID=A0ABT7AS62_9CYAN|nr:hypothetical protein [Roseofilum acuticapitatum]MDJ1169741.1 hypothetical protein [Roseofilum acuticapitatum BLCC-M154]